MDDWDETDRAKVNLIPGQAGVAGNSGDASASTPRVVMAANLTTSANNPGFCVNVTTTSTTVLASFATRRFAEISNEGSATIYLKFGTTATSANRPIPPGAGWSWPPGFSYTGVVDAIAASGTQAVCGSEW